MSTIDPQPHQPMTSADMLPARKIHRLLEYMRNMGLDPKQIARQANIDLDEVLKNSSGRAIPSLYYSLLYNETVSEIERAGKHIPWAAGLGSKFFRMMCYSLISCKTLGDALKRAEIFNEITFPLAGQQVRLVRVDENTADINYEVDDAFVRRSFSPSNWSPEECLTVARSSGIEMWMGLCGWLIGRKIAPTGVTIAGRSPHIAYHERLRDLFQCRIEFEAPTTGIEIEADFLDFRIVHNADSLEEFLATGPYQLWSTDEKLVSTIAAIKSLLGNDFTEGIPSFEVMASNMHMSASTLRRHLLAEGTSYQQIKNDRRRDIAIELLCMSDTKISDISHRTGFSDTSSFVRSFRAWTGVTPKNYRDNAKPNHLQN